MGAEKIKENNKNVYEIVTDMILDKIDAGVAPWIKPWNSHTPKNFSTSKEYRGINNTILSMLSGETGLFGTYKQFKEENIQIKKGAKSVPVVFHVFEDLEHEDDKGRDRIYKGARYYRVFSLEDTVNGEDMAKGKFDLEDFLPLSEDLRNSKVEEDLSKMVDGLGIKLTFKENSAFYQPKGHRLNMPNYKNFKTIDGYYATFFHELVHATSKDLNRDLKGHFGSKDYSFEELIAELGSAYLCQIYEVSNEELAQSASYIKGWSSKFKEDKKMIFKASSLAQIAVDHLRNKVEGLAF